MKYRNDDMEYLGKDMVKQMKKKSFFPALLMAGALFLSGCGGSVKTIDADALAKTLATEITYDDTLQELSDDEVKDADEQDRDNAVEDYNNTQKRNYAENQAEKYDSHYH